MSFLSSIKSFLGFGNDDEEKKKKQQQQAAQTNVSKPQQNAPGSIVRPNQSQNQYQSPQISQQPDNGVSLGRSNTTLGTPAGFPELLKKPAPAPAPAANPNADKRGWLSKAYDQVNVLDNGRSYKTAKPSNNTKDNAEQTGDVGRYLFNNTAKLANTGAEGVRSVTELARALTGRATGNKAAETAAEDRALDPNQSYLQKGKGVLGTGGFITPEKAKTTIAPGELTKTIVGGGLGTAGEVLPVAKPLKGATVAGKVITTGGSGAVIGAAGDVGNQLLDNRPGVDIKETLASAGVGGVLGSIPGPELRKPGKGTPEVAPGVANTVTKAADEVAPGVRSTNPTREIDAVNQVAEAQAKAAPALVDVNDVNTPAYLRKPVKDAAKAEVRQAAETQANANGAGPTPLDRPTYQHVNDIKAVIDQGDNELNDFVNANPGASMQEIEAAKANITGQVEKKIDELRAARAEAVNPAISEAPPATPPFDAPPAQVFGDPVPVDPAKQVTSMTPPDAAALIPEMPNDTSLPAQVAPAAPVEAAPNVTSQEPLLNNQQPGVSPGALPEVPSGAAPQLADAAPRTHDALVKSLGDTGANLKGKYSQREVLNLDDLKANAEGVVANLSDEDLLRTFSTTGTDTMITSPQSFALARAALDRLGQMSDDPAAVQQVVNILDAMDNFSSKSGQGLRVAQESFDSMPLPMKVRYIVKKIDSANANTKNYQALADDPAKAAVVEAQITGHLQTSQAISERVAQLEGQLNAVADAAKNGEKVDTNIKAIAKSLETERTNLAQNNGELAKFYTSQVPGRSAGQKLFSDFPRQMMLASFTGRINDLATTGANILNNQSTNITQGIIGSVVNLVKGKGTVTNTFKGTGELVKGAVRGAKKTVGEIRGNQYADDLQKSITSNTELRSGLNKTTNPVGRTIQAATEAATNLSEGVRDQRLYQLADQEAAKAGLTGDLRRQYAEARSAVPSRQMVEQADKLHKEINNLNENPVTRTLNRVAASIQGDSALGGLIKNQVMPFTSWLGGNIYNSITDKNVVASSMKFVRDAARGDTEGAVRNLSKSINGAAQAYALGYVLTQQGIITNEDAQGYNDNGAYFHIGDRYIPVGFLGFFAPNIVLGNAAYHGMNDDPNANPAEQIGTFIANVGVNGFKLIGGAQAIGAENNLQRSYEAGTRPGGSGADAAATFGAGVAGQYIPAGTGDVNAVLNNQTSLNPTKEAADTKVVNPNSPSGNAKDVPKSAIQGLKNRIPFLSQTLPRKPDVAADDLIDRTTRGNRDTPGGKATKQQAKTDAEQTADRKARGIPETKAGVETNWQNGEYDKAIEGTKYLMDQAKKKGELSKADEETYQKSIRQYTTMKDKKIDYDQYQAYKKLDLSDWRNLGDPESDTYDPKLYQKMYEIDKAFADNKASLNSDDPAKQKFSAKTKKSGSGSGRGSAEANELSRIKSNTVSSPNTPSKFNFDIKPEKAGSVKMTPIQEIRSSDLVKKRKISVKG